MRFGTLDGLIPYGARCFRAFNIRPESRMALPITFLFPMRSTHRALAAGLTALALSAAAMPALAQNPSAGNVDATGASHHAVQPRLSVSGEGKSTAAPDMAEITVGVSVQAPSASEAMAQNATRQQAVIDQIKAEGIEERDIQTTGLDLSPVQDYSQEGKPPVVTGYQARNTVTIRVRDLSGLGSLLDKLVTSGANEINGISFTRENMTEAEDAARTDAIASAAHRAEVMARAAGMTLGPIIAIQDGDAGPGPQPVQMAFARQAGDAATPIQAGELGVTARVTVIYALLTDHDGEPAAPPSAKGAN